MKKTKKRIQNMPILIITPYYWIFANFKIINKRIFIIRLKINHKIYK